MQLKSSLIIASLVFVIGVIVGWFLRPTGEQIIRPIIEKNFTVSVTDTVLKIEKIEFEKIVYKDVVHFKTDTIYSDSVDRRKIENLVSKYDSLQKVLIANGFERIKYYNEITKDGDSVYIELASVKDLILKLELNLAAKEVVTKNLNTYYKPIETPEAWYIKPAIAVSSFGLGYLIRGNVK